jgi:hypothetical protein
VFEFIDVDVDEVFECVAELFDGDVELELEVFMFDDGAAVVEVDDEFVTVADELLVVIVFVFERLVLVLLAVSPPHAAPSAAKPKSAESAIAFFILKTISCLSQRLICRIPP